MSKTFEVQYYHKKSGTSGNGARARISGTIGQALHGAQSETAVLSYLQQKHRGEEITIFKLDWKG